jgi:hypothetical protein
MIDILIALAAIAAIFLLLTLKYLSEFVNTHGIHKITGRALLGRKLDGKRHTTATFWRKSDGVTRGHPSGRVGKRHHRAGIANLARTLAWMAVLCLSGYGAMQNLKLTIILDGIALSLFGGYNIFRLIIKLRAWYMKRTYISPLAEAIGPILELTGPETEDLITMKPDYLTRKTGEIGRINLPPRFAANRMQTDVLDHLVSSRLPVGAELEPRLKGRTPHLLIKAVPALPNMVPFADYIPKIEALEPRQYIPGIIRSGNTYTAEFGGENPHHGYCWGSGRGKSTILKSIVSQTFHNDPEATGTVIDPKDISLDCLVGVPGLDFYNDSGNIPGMWEGIGKVYDLMMDRYAQKKADPSLEFSTHLLLMEEANSFSVMSRIVWQQMGGKGATPPIWPEKIAPLFWRSRQVNIFIILVAQSIQERFLGNLNLRPSLGMLSLSGYKPSQYANYVGTTPIPRPQKGRGRAIYVDGDEETWVQCLYAADTEFRDFAMANRMKHGAVKPSPRVSTP